jgi:tRNA (guanine37-N1)-methyltransferase
MRIDILTLFPEMFSGVLSASILKRAVDKGIVQYHLHQLRDYTQDPHRKVDDRPFGGGAGMVLMCQPVIDAVEKIATLEPTPARWIVLCPQGRKLDQPLVDELARLPRILLVAGHYEGFDERIKVVLDPLEVSIGDYVLSGGELPAMVLLDAIVRLLPGVLGDAQSHVSESFATADPIVTGGLEYPQYTRPREYRGLTVPEALLSGNHEAIALWRRQQSLERTARKRPDLLPKPPAE